MGINRETRLVESIMRSVDARLKREKSITLGIVTAVSAGSAEIPPTVRVDGHAMQYLDSYVDPVKGDLVAYLKSDRLVLGRRARYVAP